MPLSIKIVNFFLRLVPSDGVIKLVEARNFHYAPGQEDTAAYLWQMLRYQWRDRATGLRIDYDPRSPLHHVLRPSPIHPTTSITYAVHAPERIDTARLINPYL
jgi:hypothetical protein